MAGEIVLVDQIEPLIVSIRGQNVLLDSRLAKFYGVTTKALNQAVKRSVVAGLASGASTTRSRG
jgi:hypothetical protein